jgi:hypothetical protein
MRAVGAVDRVAVRCSSRSGGQPSRGSRQPLQGYYGGQGGHGHQIKQQDGPFDQKLPQVALPRQTPQAHSKGCQGGGSGRGGSGRATAAADWEKNKRLAAEFEALGGGALTMALAQDAEPGDSLRECWLAHEGLRVSEARSINCAEILTARTDASAEVAEAAAA